MATPVKIQLRHNNNIYGSKNEAISTINDFVKAHISDNMFIDGEIITLRYYDINGDICSVSAIIDIDGNKVSVSTMINDNDTIKIVETDKAPSNDYMNYLWLDENSGETTEGFYLEIKALREQVKALRELCNRMIYAFNEGIDPGDIKNNSTKQFFMESADPQDPREIIDSGETYEKPEYPLYDTPNVRSVLMKTVESEGELLLMKDYVIPNELIYCYGNNGIYTKHPKTLKLVKLNGNTSESGDTITIIITQDKGLDIEDKGNTVYVDNENGLNITQTNKIYVENNILIINS